MLKEYTQISAQNASRSDLLLPVALARPKRAPLSRFHENPLQNLSGKTALDCAHVVELMDVLRGELFIATLNVEAEDHAQAEQDVLAAEHAWQTASSSAIDPDLVIPNIRAVRG